MSGIRSLVQASLVAACAAVSFVSFQAYMSAKAEVAPAAIFIVKVDPIKAKADPISQKLAEDSDLTGKPFKGTMSPIYATTKYTQAQLALPAAKKPVKAKLAARTVHKMPIQLAANTPVTAYAPAPRIADRTAPVFASIR